MQGSVGEQTKRFDCSILPEPNHRNIDPDEKRSPSLVVSVGYWMPGLDYADARRAWQATQLQGQGSTANAASLPQWLVDSTATKRSARSMSSHAGQLRNDRLIVFFQ